MNASKTRLTATLPDGRLLPSPKTTVYKYSAGWELFFFTMDSPYYGKSWGEIFGLIAGGDLFGVVNDVWNRQIWHHSKVAWAIGETILMAFIGTIGAALISAAGLSRGDQFLAGQSAEIWFQTLFISCAVSTILSGQSFCHALWSWTDDRCAGHADPDIGSFGKLFSEALENVDNKQIEGVESTGAKGIEKYRFGVIPQIMPVLLSQVLYYLESNTRSATVIGAIVGAGIGLLLTQAIITQKNWEEVTYYLALMLMVMVMDFISGKIRGWLIHGGR